LSFALYLVNTLKSGHEPWVYHNSCFFAGRLATYKYINMDQAFKNALDLFYRLNPASG